MRRRLGTLALDAPAVEVAELALRRALDELRAGLGEGSYLLGNRFSYADVAMATALSYVQPVDDAYLRLGPATRAARTQERLAGEYPDLLTWRDQIYANHRRSTPAAPGTD